MKKINLVIMLFLVFNCDRVTAQYGGSLREGQACNMITQTQLKNYQSKLQKLVNIAQLDKDKYGTSGAYPATAIQFYRNALMAYDSLQVTINWLNTGSNNIPDNTNYAEASAIKNWMAWSIIPALTAANHWAELSAIYHKSAYAACGREETMKLLVEAVNLLAYSSQCYFEPYKIDIPPPSCK